jgi:hypothetical protein
MIEQKGSSRALAHTRKPHPHQLSVKEDSF